MDEKHIGTYELASIINMMWISWVHDVTVQTISVQCKEYMTFILADVTIWILGRFGIKLEKAMPLRYKHRKINILMFFCIIYKRNYTFFNAFPGIFER